jgi:hypothetical protein
MKASRSRPSCTWHGVPVPERGTTARNQLQLAHAGASSSPCMVHFAKPLHAPVGPASGRPTMKGRADGLRQCPPQRPTQRRPLPQPVVALEAIGTATRSKRLRVESWGGAGWQPGPLRIRIRLACWMQCILSPSATAHDHASYHQAQRAAVRRQDTHTLPYAKRRFWLSTHMHSNQLSANVHMTIFVLTSE